MYQKAVDSNAPMDTVVPVTPFPNGVFEFQKATETQWSALEAPVQ
jgi:hypothetical protein